MNRINRWIVALACIVAAAFLALGPTRAEDGSLRDAAFSFVESTRTLIKSYTSNSGRYERPVDIVELYLLPGFNTRDAAHISGATRHAQWWCGISGRDAFAMTLTQDAPPHVLIGPDGVVKVGGPFLYITYGCADP